MRPPKQTYEERRRRATVALLRAKDPAELRKTLDFLLEIDGTVEPEDTGHYVARVRRRISEIREVLGTE